MFAENYSGMAFFRDFHIRRNTDSHQAIALHPRKCSSVSVVQCQLEYRVEWEIQAVFVSVTSLFSLCLLSLPLFLSPVSALDSVSPTYFSCRTWSEFRHRSNGLPRLVPMSGRQRGRWSASVCRRVLQLSILTVAWQPCVPGRAQMREHVVTFGNGGKMLNF